MAQMVPPKQEKHYDQVPGNQFELHPRQTTNKLEGISSGIARYPFSAAKSI